MEQDKHNPFEYQRPTDEHIEKIKAVREACSDAYNALICHVPQCAERTLAIRHLEEVSMWANKAIVFDGQRYL